MKVDTWTHIRDSENKRSRQRPDLCQICVVFGFEHATDGDDHATGDRVYSNCALQSARHLLTDTASSAAVMRSWGFNVVHAVTSLCIQSGHSPAGQTGRAAPDASVRSTSSSDRPWYGVAAFVYTCQQTPILLYHWHNDWLKRLFRDFMLKLLLCVCAADNRHWTMRI